MQEMSWNNYLKWVVEVCNQEYNGNITDFNNAMIDMVEN